MGRCCESRKRGGAGTCRGTFKVPRSSHHAGSACSSPPGCVSTRPGGGEEPAGGHHLGPGAPAPIPRLPVQRPNVRCGASTTCKSSSPRWPEGGNSPGEADKELNAAGLLRPSKPLPAWLHCPGRLHWDFENNSEFSQKYQASQNCMCDTEHMFACPQPKQQ